MEENTTLIANLALVISRKSLYIFLNGDMVAIVSNYLRFFAVQMYKFDYDNLVLVFIFFLI